ncbi:hypothetical protein M951_chr1166 (nucleomorph) [Lotharella oceanica]|uniref:Uncharacterized protein n=1 Tax=Lotharella oceanica TaxID=641309 RepID=A0A060DAW7_9EUKA|nr:hypothetical protein M951_chr1166 [Lotharella oceanica]
MNIIYKKNLESFFLYPTFSTLILFFGNHEIIKKISSILMKYSFTETRVQNYIIILLSGAVNNIIQQQNSYNVINKKLDISQLTTSEILNYITMKSFYIRNNYKKYILEILIKNNNYLDYFTFNKTTLLLIIKHIIKLFIFFKKKININLILNKIFFKNLLLSEKNKKIFFFKGIILKKKSTINKFRKFKYINIKIILLQFEKIFRSENLLQTYRNNIKYITIIQKILTHFFYKLKKYYPVIVLTNSNENNFINYISKKFGIIIESKLNLNTMQFLQSYLDLKVYDFMSILNISRSLRLVTRLNIINEKYKKWIFLTNINNNFFVTLIGSFNKYFLFEYCTTILKSLISKIYNLLIDFRLSLDNGSLECTILRHINNTSSDNINHIYYFPLISIIMQYSKYNEININKFFKNLTVNTSYNTSIIKLNYKNYKWSPVNEKKLVYKIAEKIINEIF